MPVLGDFEFVTSGGSFTSTVAFTTTFKTGGRYGKGALSYLLVELYSRKLGSGASGSIELLINGKTWTTIPVNGSSRAVHVVRFDEQSLFANKKNTFEARAKNAAGEFGNVICHFHQSSD